MKYLSLLLLLGVGLWQNVPAGQNDNCPKGKVCTSGNTTGTLRIDKFPENQPANLTEALNKALNAYIEKHCRVVLQTASFTMNQLAIPHDPGDSQPRLTTFGQIKCDQ